MNPSVSLFQQKIVQEVRNIQALYLSVGSIFFQAFERILFTWGMRHPASGYVQGINDLVTPFFLVFLGDYMCM